MSAVLGHELRNPLAALKGHAQLLLEKLPKEHPGHRGAQTIVRESVRLENLASDVLEFVRSGRVEPELIDPVAVARAAVETTGDRVKLAVNGSIPVWPIDRARIEAVLINLLRNARQASPEAADVELAVSAENGEDLVFEVRDHGTGIDPEDQQRIFEPFFTKRAKGTGLGLTLARQIVEGHGGRTAAESHPEGGAVFRVTIPRKSPLPAFSRGE
jgi:two-component system sensor histidine kinase HydH